MKRGYGADNDDDVQMMDEEQTAPNEEMLLLLSSSSHAPLEDTCCQSTNPDRCTDFNQEKQVSVVIIIINGSRRIKSVFVYIECTFSRW